MKISLSAKHGTQDCSADKFIMSPAVDNGRNHWSNCTVIFT